MDRMVQTGIKWIYGMVFYVTLYYNGIYTKAEILQDAMTIVRYLPHYLANIYLHTSLRF